MFIDTSIIIDFLAGDEKIVSLIQEIANKEEIKTTSITEYELLKHKTKLKRQLAEDFLSELHVYPFDTDAAKKAALLFRELNDSGKMINENDLLIPGIVLALDEVLLTRDRKLASVGKSNIKIV
ncbi:MAG TPA: type II toxin-antitoxin system VapC family toxin [Candidatus Acidoferrum sp.]|nr:type II toxin-antitoxin system VapC family toxin [Candidatus Acidoferrum sp.]